jgi:hypothetical protein
MPKKPSPPKAPKSKKLPRKLPEDPIARGRLSDIGDIAKLI